MSTTTMTTPGFTRDSLDEGISLATLETRRNLLENELFEVAGALSERLHAVERRTAYLQAQLHEAVCETGRMPIEERTRRVNAFVAEMANVPELAGTEQLGERVAHLKRRVEQLEAGILNRLRSLPAA